MPPPHVSAHPIEVESGLPAQLPFGPGAVRPAVVRLDADAPAAALLDEGVLRSYHYAPSVRGDLLERLGRYAEAQTEFERAAGLTRNARERELLIARARACGERG